MVTGFIRLYMGVDVLLSFYAVFVLFKLSFLLFYKSNMMVIKTNYIYIYILIYI